MSQTPPHGAGARLLCAAVCAWRALGPLDLGDADAPGRGTVRRTCPGSSHRGASHVRGKLHDWPSHFPVSTAGPGMPTEPNMLSQIRNQSCPMGEKDATLSFTLAGASFAVLDKLGEASLMKEISEQVRHVCDCSLATSGMVGLGCYCRKGTVSHQSLEDNTVSRSCKAQLRRLRFDPLPIQPPRREVANHCRRRGCLLISRYPHIGTF